MKLIVMEIGICFLGFGKRINFLKEKNNILILWNVIYLVFKIIVFFLMMMVIGYNY